MKQTFGLSSLSPLLVVLDHQEEYSFCPFPTSATAFGRNGSRNPSDPEEFFLFTALNAASRAWHGGVLFKKKKTRNSIALQWPLSCQTGWVRWRVSILPRASKNPAENRKVFLVTATPLSFCEFFQLEYVQHSIILGFWRIVTLIVCLCFMLSGWWLIISLAPAPSYIFIVHSQPAHSSLLPL